MASKKFMKWGRYSSLPIETRLITDSTYDHEGKKDEPQKKYWNGVVSIFLIDYQIFYLLINETIENVKRLNCLILDGVLCGTSSIMSEVCSIHLDSLYICSNEVAFRGALPGRTYTGNLSEFIEAIHFKADEKKFALIVFDFCSGWSLEMKTCFERILSLDYLEPIGILAFTIRFSRQEKAEYYHANNVEIFKRISDIGRSRGFIFGYKEMTINLSSHIASYVIKFMHPKTALDHKTGFECDQFNRCADAWLYRAPNKITFEDALKANISVNDHLFDRFGFNLDEIKRTHSHLDIRSLKKRKLRESFSEKELSKDTSLFSFTSLCKPPKLFSFTRQKK